MALSTPAASFVVVNEALTHSNPPLKTAIELHNPTAQLVNVSGWFLTDDQAIPRKYRIPDGTIIVPNGYVVFDETQFNANPGASNCFALNAGGGSI